MHRGTEHQRGKRPQVRATGREAMVAVDGSYRGTACWVSTEYTDAQTAGPELRLPSDALTGSIS
jgi:hypothetical protein